MTRSLRKLVAMAAVPLCLAWGPASAAEDYFILFEAQGTPEEVVARIREHVEGRGSWMYLADFPLAGGAAISVQLCYTPVGPMVMSGGMHLMAMMPCGSLAVYFEDGSTRISLLDPVFWTPLHPDPDFAGMMEVTSLAFRRMLDEVLE